MNNCDGPLVVSLKDELLRNPCYYFVIRTGVVCNCSQGRFNEKLQVCV